MTKRPPINNETTAKLMYLSERTCAVCNQYGKAVQIHHIDENPSNNSLDNLVLLCFDCHNDTQLRGGFGRKLNAQTVIVFRNEWHERVLQRRQQADQIAVSVTTKDANVVDHDLQYCITEAMQSEDHHYIWMIPVILKQSIVRLREKYDGQTTLSQIEYYMTVCTLIKKMAITISSNFDSESDGGNLIETTERAFDDTWHWLRSLYINVGFGTFANIAIGSAAANATKKIVADLVLALYAYGDSFKYSEWVKVWDSIDANYFSS